MQEHFILDRRVAWIALIVATVHLAAEVFFSGLSYFRSTDENVAISVEGVELTDFIDAKNFRINEDIRIMSRKSLFFPELELIEFPDRVEGYLEDFREFEFFSGEILLGEALEASKLGRSDLDILMVILRQQNPAVLKVLFPDDRLRESQWLGQSASFDTELNRGINPLKVDYNWQNVLDSYRLQSRYARQISENLQEHLDKAENIPFVGRKDSHWLLHVEVRNIGVRLASVEMIGGLRVHDGERNLRTVPVEGRAGHEKYVSVAPGTSRLITLRTRHDGKNAELEMKDLRQWFNAADKEFSITLRSGANSLVHSPREQFHIEMQANRRNAIIKEIESHVEPKCRLPGFNMLFC